MLNWQTIGVAMRSPIVRATAAVPLAGYFIIYSGEVTDWLNTRGLTEGKEDPFWFSTEAKLRMIYYGGISMMVALLVYFWKCPEDVKRYKSAEESAQDFLNGNHVHRLEVALKDGEEVIKKNQHSKIRDRAGTYRYLVNNITIFLYRIYRDNINSDAITKDQSDFYHKIKGLIGTGFLIYGIDSINNTNNLVGGGFHYFRSGNYETDTLRSAKDIIEAKFEIDSLSSYFSLYITALLTAFGGVLLLLPAFETFAHVIYLDVASIWSQIASGGA